jgi:hypothetical protein
LVEVAALLSVTLETQQVLELDVAVMVALVAVAVLITAAVLQEAQELLALLVKDMTEALNPEVTPRFLVAAAAELVVEVVMP